MKGSKPAALVAAGLAGLTLATFELVHRLDTNGHTASPSTGRPFDVLTRPPTFVPRGRPVKLTYEIVCPLRGDQPPTPAMLKTFCRPRGTLHVRRDGESDFSEIALAGTSHRASAIVPAEYTTGAGFDYYVEIQDERGVAVTVPEGGADAPARARIVSRWRVVKLARHTFGHTRAPDAIVVRGNWGRGRGKFGADVGKEQAAIGPSAFDIAPDGSIVVLDQLNKRLVVSSRGRRRSVPIRFDGGEGDLAIGPDETVYVLDPAENHAVRAYRLSGRLAYRATAPGEEVDFVRAGPRGPIVYGFPGEMWFPVAEDGRPLAHAEQVARARPGQTFADGSEVVALASPSYHGARYQLLGERPGAWMLRSMTMLGEIQLAQPYRAGLAVVTRFWTETKSEFVFLELTPRGLGQSFAIKPVEDLDSNASGTFRLHGNTLYQLRSSRTQLEIAAYRLG